MRFLLTAILIFVAGFAYAAGDGEVPRAVTYPYYPPAPQFQTWGQADTMSNGCVTCHTDSDQKTMHISESVVLGCADCHGGDPSVRAPANAMTGVPAYRAAQDKAHVQPLYPESWHYPHSANPERSYTLLNKESPEYVRFVNPSDYRVARTACGSCHLPIIQAAERSLMATGAMLWGGAAYNNGILPYKKLYPWRCVYAGRRPGDHQEPRRDRTLDD